MSTNGDRGRPTLLRALALAAEAVGASADGVPAAEDPLRLDLPALHPRLTDLPKPATVGVFAALYLAAQLEEAGIVPIAELFAEERYTLNLSSDEAATKLEEFALRGREWYDRAGRTQIYARLFGIGPAATNDAGAFVNRQFVPLLADCCRALARFGDVSATGYAGAGAEAAVRMTAYALLANIAPRALGNTQLAARRLEDQVRHAVDILRHPAIGALVGARTLQQVVVAVLGADAPDVQRLIDAGLTGQKVLLWLAAAEPRLGAGASAPLMTYGDAVAVTAALWLHAAGVEEPSRQAA